MSLERFIFKEDSRDRFYDFSDDFHDLYVTDLMMFGWNNKGTELEKLPMTIMSKYKGLNKYYKKVFGGLLKVNPRVLVELRLKEAPVVQMAFTYLNNNNDVDEVIMTQTVSDWPALGKFTFEIYRLDEDVSIKGVEEFWKS